MEYKMESAHSGSYPTSIDNKQFTISDNSMTQTIQNKESLIDYDKISATKFDIENEVEKRILSHIGNYIEEPFNIIESYF